MNITFIKSPNYSTGRRGYTPMTIVIHIMEGTLVGTDSWFQNPQSNVSAHYGIGATGEVHQYVNEKNTAWHAGRVNNPTWSLIKHSSDGSGSYINPNFYTIGIEHEGWEETDWTDEMYNSSSQLIKEIATRWNIPLDRDHIVGHHQIYSLKDCPGSKVDINKLIAMADGTYNSDTAQQPLQKTEEKGKVTTQTDINIRLTASTAQPPINRVPKGIQLAYDGYVINGESIKDNSKWYYTNEGNWFWSGAVS